MLSFMQYFTIDFICSYQMATYPFDTQECAGTIEIEDLLVKLVPQTLDYIGPKDLMKYNLIGNAIFIQTSKVNILRLVRI